MTMFFTIYFIFKMFIGFEKKVKKIHLDIKYVKVQINNLLNFMVQSNNNHLRYSCKLNI